MVWMLSCRIIRIKVGLLPSVPSGCQTTAVDQWAEANSMSPLFRSVRTTTRVSLPITLNIRPARSALARSPLRLAATLPQCGPRGRPGRGYGRKCQERCRFVLDGQFATPETVFSVNRGGWRRISLRAEVCPTAAGKQSRKASMQYGQPAEKAGKKNTRRQKGPTRHSRSALG